MMIFHTFDAVHLLILLRTSYIEIILISCCLTPGFIILFYLNEII